MKRTDLFTLLVLFVMLGAAVSSIAAAGWMPGLGVAGWAMGLGLLAGTAMAFSSFTGWMAHVTSFIYGLFVVTVIGGAHSSVPQNLGWRERVYLIVDKIITWVHEAASNGASRESLIFVLILCGLFWLLSYTAAWYSFRQRRIWHVILPTGVTLFSNIYYYNGERPMTPYLVIYLICALILLVESHLADREEDWLRERVRFTQGLRKSFTLAGIGIAAVALLFAWRVPEIAASETARGVFKNLNTPYGELLARWNRLFATLQNNVQQPVDNYNSALTLGGPRHLTTDPVMDVTAPPLRYYWRATSYDHYDGITWVNTFVQTRDLAAQDTSVALTAYEDRVPVSPQFVLYRGTDSIFAAGLPLSANLPSQAVYAKTDDGTLELVQLKLPAPLLPGNRFTSDGSVSLADAIQLRLAPRNYPRWVLDHYFQLPANIPDRVKQLARNIAGAQPTDYDKAVAIESWLRANITYDEQIEAPPPDVEASDYLLFRTRRGYCNYYATAMVVMLRSLGVPARVATGYAQGDMTSISADNSSATYNVKVNDSHTWVEVFFTQFGWVEFEPTAGQPALQHRDSGQGTTTATPNAPAATPTPLPNFDATPTPSPAQLATSQPPPPQNPLANLLKSALGILAVLVKIAPYVLAVGLLALVAVFSMRFAEEAGFEHLPPVQRAYAMLSRWATWMGIGQEHTPYEQAHEISARVPETEAPTQTITELYVENRFGATAPDAEQEHSARTAWEQVRRELRLTWLKRRIRRLPFIKK